MSVDGPIGARVAQVRRRIEAACARSDRSPDSVRLIAVTKTVPAEAVVAGHRAGLRDFGENRATELAGKRDALQGLDATWHFLGALQTGTIRHVADHADVVHSAEPGRAMERLARRVSHDGRTMPVLLEVDFTGVRRGVAPEDVPDAASTVAGVRGIRLVGLMTIAPQTPDPEGARPSFRRLRELRDGLAERFPDAVELSMGMSFDYAIGVEEGATMVRVGTAIFGPRPARARA
jgi:PLP dependent protein